jgi:VPDSG-CTERM motif
MKNRSSKTILLFVVLGLISCALCVQQAQAIPTSVIAFSGGATMADANGNPATSVNNATHVTGWLNPTVDAVSGVFDVFVNVGDAVTMSAPWTFGAGLNALWSVGGFTFNLIASTILFQQDGSLFVSGTGIITGNGLHSTGTWSFGTGDDAATNGVFSFSASSATPDGGATVALLGLALAGIEGIRRKLMRAKSCPKS